MTTTGADAADDGNVGRHVAAVFDKFERDTHQCQELLCQVTSHWLLSTDEPTRAAAVGGVTTTTEPPPGIITSLTAVPQSRLILLIPADDNSFAGVLDMREVFLTFSSLKITNRSV